MTVLYGGLFTVITVAVLVAAQQLQISLLTKKIQDIPYAPQLPCDQSAPCPPQPSGDLSESLAGSQRTITLVAIAVIAVLAFAVCWWLTGRLLRPLRRITDTARRLSLSTMHERIALAGTPDELKELADTFDAMLDRLADAVASQRRFIANASHELRTPLAIQRTAIEVGLADPSPEELARIRAELLRNTQRSEQLIEGLLLLAQGERGLDARAPVDLEAVIAQVIADHLPLAESGRITVTAATGPLTVAGDEVMLTRLVANLVHNAIRHNHRGGRVTVDLTPADATLVVRNTGPPVPPERFGELFEPFRRLRPDRTGPPDGAGLGLSIVAAIAHAHGGTVQAAPYPGGGLAVTVTLPPLTGPGSSM